MCETQAVAAAFARTLRAGDVVGLSGTLGTGKTVFARGIIAALLGTADVFQGSPTFALVQEYRGPAFPVYHFDFYRIEHVEELYAIGWQEYCGCGGICLVEWAERFPEVLPRHTRWVRLRAAGDTRREIAIDA